MVRMFTIAPASGRLPLFQPANSLRSNSAALQKTPSLPAGAAL